MLLYICNQDLLINGNQSFTGHPKSVLSQAEGMLCWT